MNEREKIHCEHDTDVPLREYIERIFDERDKALQVAYANMEKRLDKLNELRAEVQEDRAQLLTKDKYDSEHGILEDRVSELEKNSVRYETISNQADEVRRMRRQLAVTIVAGAVLVGINFIVNIIQSTGGKLP